MSKVIILIILTAIFWGSAPIVEKIGLSESTPIIGVTVRSIVVSIFLLLYLLIKGNIKSLISLSPKALTMFCLSGVLAGGLGMLTYFGALKLGVTSRVVPLAATYPLVTAFLSVLILGEEVTIPRIAGTVLIVLGVCLVK